MKVQVLQHVPFEGIGSIESWMRAKGASVSTTRLFTGADVPCPSDFDWLIAMGGPMSVNDERVYAWLRSEKELIAHAVAAGKIVLGICLGAQLIASALGARVFPHTQKEIGWFPVHRVAGASGALVELFPPSTEVFHWHGETFDLPGRAVRFLQSDACANQAFAIGEHVLGLQFHLETTPDSAASLIVNSRDQIVPGPTIQTEQEMLARADRFPRINRLMDSVLALLARRLLPGGIGHSTVTS